MEAICPKCQFENIVDSSSTRLVCARCATIFEITRDQTSLSRKQRIIQDYTTPAEPEFMGWPVLPENNFNDEPVLPENNFDNEEETSEFASSRKNVLVSVALLLLAFGILFSLGSYFLGVPTENQLLWVFIVIFSLLFAISILALGIDWLRASFFTSRTTPARLARKQELANPAPASKELPKASMSKPLKESYLNRFLQARAKKLVFISYRRKDSNDVTGRIYDRLTKHFGRKNIFKDVDSIPLGVDFRNFLTDSVGQCNMLLAVIGQEWLTSTKEEGTRRLDDPDDFVRIEIETALQRDIPVIPLLVQGTPMPAKLSLPESLRSLAYRNAIQIRPDPDFHKDMDRLIKHIEEHFKK